MQSSAEGLPWGVVGGGRAALRCRAARRAWIQYGVLGRHRLPFKTLAPCIVLNYTTRHKSLSEAMTSHGCCWSLAPSMGV